MGWCCWRGRVCLACVRNRGFPGCGHTLHLLLEQRVEGVIEISFSFPCSPFHTLSWPRSAALLLMRVCVHIYRSNRGGGSKRGGAQQANSKKRSRHTAGHGSSGGAGYDAAGAVDAAAAAAGCGWQYPVEMMEGVAAGYGALGGAFKVR